MRYYLPSHHPAVGPLSGPDPNSQQLQQQEGSGRWRAALGVGNKVDYSGEDHLPRVLAYMVQQELDEYKKTNPNWPDQQQSGAGPARPQALMLITDRTMDIAAPMVHEFTYQAMANDLLEITNGVKFRCVSIHANDLTLKPGHAGTNSSHPVVYMKTKLLLFPMRIKSGFRPGICTCVRRLINLWQILMLLSRRMLDSRGELKVYLES